MKSFTKVIVVFPSSNLGSGTTLNIMKVLFTKAIGRYADESCIGKVHLSGFFDTTACGLADEDYEMKETKKPIDCSTCKDVLGWAKDVAKKIKQ